MLSQTKKKGVSIVIGYVLLIGLAVIMGGFLYIWMKSYVPGEALECPEGTSLTIKEYYYNCSEATMNITLKNNGRFDIAGYFIHASNNPNITLPTINIYDKVTGANGAISYGGYGGEGSNSILFDVSNDNTFKPNQEIEHEFEGVGQIYYLQLIPVRWQEHKNVLRFVSCGEASASKEKINCSS